jgi:segregation and condensation protein B
MGEDEVGPAPAVLEAAEGAGATAPAGGALAILEAALFAAEEPLTLVRLAEVLEEPDGRKVRGLVEALRDRLAADGRGLEVVEVAGGYAMLTRPDLAPWVRRLRQGRPARLSRAALETLAVIAYKQPITKAEIEEVRGVNADGVLRTLAERELIRVIGRKAEPGRPILYGTSRSFLEHFGFKDLSDLPTLREIEALLGATEAPGPAAPAE